MKPVVARRPVPKRHHALVENSVTKVGVVDAKMMLNVAKTRSVNKTNVSQDVATISPVAKEGSVSKTNVSQDAAMIRVARVSKSVNKRDARPKLAAQADPALEGYVVKKDAAKHVPKMMNAQTRSVSKEPVAKDVGPTRIVRMQSVTQPTIVVLPACKQPTVKAEKYVETAAVTCVLQI